MASDAPVLSSFVLQARPIITKMRAATLTGPGPAPGELTALGLPVLSGANFCAAQGHMENAGDFPSWSGSRALYVRQVITKTYRDVFRDPLRASQEMLRISSHSFD
jgi:hypothetical protein